MLKRIVKLTIKESEREKFIAAYMARQQKINAFEGCSGVELLIDSSSPTTFFTYSLWETESQLNAYRDSVFFKETWSIVKPMFAARAQAWSLVAID